MNSKYKDAYLLAWVHMCAHSLSRCTYKQGRLSFYFYFIFILFYLFIIYWFFVIIIYLFYFLLWLLLLSLLLLLLFLFVCLYFNISHDIIFIIQRAQENLIRICRPKFGKSMTAARCLNGFSSDIQQVYFDVLTFLIIGLSRFLTQRNVLFFLYDTVICNLLLFVQIKNSWFLIDCLSYRPHYLVRTTHWKKCGPWVIDER